MPKKHSDKTPVENIIMLLKFMLQENRFITLNEFVDKLEISKQAILRYLERVDLSYFGKLEKTKIGREVAYRLVSNWKFTTFRKGLQGMPDFSMVEVLWQIASAKNGKKARDQV